MSDTSEWGSTESSLIGPAGGWAPPAKGGWTPPEGKPPRRSRGKLLGIAALAAGVAIMLTAGIAFGSSGKDTAKSAASSAPSAPAVPSDTPPPADLNTNLAVGDTMWITQNGEDAAKITVTRVSAQQYPSDQYGSAPRNGWFVTAHVKVKVMPGYTGGFSVYSGDFYMKHGSEHYSEGDDNAMDAPGGLSEISTDELGAGETAHGTLVFDVPSPYGVIKYSPNLDGQAVGGWRVTPADINGAGAPASSSAVHSGSNGPYLDALAAAGIVAPDDWAVQTASNLEAAWANGETESQTNQEYLIPGGIYQDHLATFNTIVHKNFG